MSFVRPELQEQLFRWRQAVIGVGVLTLGALLFFSTFGITQWVSVVIALGGAGLLWDGVRRARFPSDHGGLGVVEIRERQIIYLSPVGGGTISIEDLVRIEIDTADLGTGLPDLFWIFRDSAGNHLTIPGNAEGTEALFDALTALRGVNFDALAHIGDSARRSTVVVWQKPGTGPKQVEYLRNRS